MKVTVMPAGWALPITFEGSVSFNVNEPEGFVQVVKIANDIEELIAFFPEVIYVYEESEGVTVTIGRVTQ